jgi:hypothetical protein
MVYTLEDQIIEDQFDADWYLQQNEEDEVVNTIPVAIKEAAQAICTEYKGLVLTSIAHVVDSPTYIAWYKDPTLHPDEDGYTLFREFRFVTSVAIDTYK